MARPLKRYRIRVRGHQRDDLDADLLMQALLLMAEERAQTADNPDERNRGTGSARTAEEPA